MSEEDKIKKEQAEGESGGEKEQAKSKIDKIEKILGAKIVYACPRYVRGQGNGWLLLMKTAERVLSRLVCETPP